MAVASRLFHSPSPHCSALGKGCSHLGEEEPPVLMGENMAGKKEETIWHFVMGFPCKLFLYLLPFVINVAAVTVLFLVSLLLSVNCSYLSL